MAAFGGGYLLLLLDERDIGMQQPASILQRALITQQVLDVLATVRGLEVRSSQRKFKLWDDPIYDAGAVKNRIGGGFFDVDPEGLDEPASGGSAGSSVASGTGNASGSMGPSPGMSSLGHSSMGLPGMGSGSGMMAGAPPIATPWTYASYNHFLITGHCAFLILVGLGGGALCRWTFRQEDAGQAAR